MFIPLSGQSPKHFEGHQQLLGRNRQNERMRKGVRQSGTNFTKDGPMYPQRTADEPEPHSEHPYSSGNPGSSEDFPQFSRDPAHDSYDVGSCVSEPSCSELSWSPWPEGACPNDTNVVLGETWCKIRKAKRQLWAVRGEAPRNRFGQSRGPFERRRAQRKGVGKGRGDV